MWPFKKKVEKRSSAAGYTSAIMAARESYISGRSGVGELTATVQSCIGLWEGGLSLADVSGTDLLDRRSMGLLGRSMALRGEAVYLIRDSGLIACSDWDLRTRNGVPTAYRVQISEAGGGRAETALAGEVLHVRVGADASTPYYGTAPLKRAELTADMLSAIEAALSEVYRDAPLGSQIVPLPESASSNIDEMRGAFRGRRGSVLVVEGVAQSVAAGMHPQSDKKPDQISPDLSKSMTKESLEAARNAISMAFGVLPGLTYAATTGPMVREAQRHLAQWQLQPIASLLAEEATAKLGSPVEIDVMRPLQAYDAGGRARAAMAIVQAMAQAKDAGVDPKLALDLVDWK